MRWPLEVRSHPPFNHFVVVVVVVDDDGCCVRVSAAGNGSGVVREGSAAALEAPLVLAERGGRRRLGDDKGRRVLRPSVRTPSVTGWVLKILALDSAQYDVQYGIECKCDGTI